jgi:Na+-driven multidrug efflux pump
MFIARIIAKWGPIPIAVQKIGSQIESISWMTATGFSTALGAFVGQNYGAGKWGRIYKGYFRAIGIVSIIGLFATGLLIFGARPIFSLFIPEAEAVKIGVDYLKILGLSQLFMTIEITTAGAFNGLGKTTTPALIGIVFNGLRIPGAIFLSSIAALGLNGVWWSISISSIFKGIILATLFIILLYRSPEVKHWRNQDKLRENVEL